MESKDYLHLRAENISSTVNELHKRVCERFSERGISQVSETLSKTALASADRASELSRPIYWLKFISVLSVLCLFLPLALVSSSLKVPETGIPLTEFIQSLEAGLNDLVLIGAAIYFMFSLERRIRRAKALRALDELRSLAHIIDMHQLTKDPERYVRGAASDQEENHMNPDQLSYYLDYCSEMLSLVGKIAALYAAKLEDGVVLQAVNEVESLTTALSGKIWQKIMILNQTQMFAK